MHSTMKDTSAHIVVMGIAGCGKSEVGRRLAETLGGRFIEGDAYHSEASRAKMSAGIPLNDDDRWRWLDTLGEVCRTQTTPGFVLACSALRQVYRQRLRAALPGLRFVFLDTPRALSVQRVGARVGHFMPASLVDSQLATLEVPTGEPGVVTVAADQPLAAVVAQALRGLATGPGEITREGHRRP